MQLKLSVKEKEERKRAKATCKVLGDFDREGKTEYIGKTIAEANGVSLSQISAYVEGNAVDQDGEPFHSPDGLYQMRRTHTDISSSDNDSDNGSNQEETN